MTAHVALLRAINVGGKNKLPMRQLVAMFEAAGCTNVQTYIQSGNVVFDASASLAERIAHVIPQQLQDVHALKVPVVLRSARELTAAAENNPFERDEDTHVLFLAEKPSRSVVAKLDPNRSPGDEFAVVGREVYLFCPNGIGRSKLTNDYFERILSTPSTARNFRTIRKLIEMATR